MGLKFKHHIQVESGNGGGGEGGNGGGGEGGNAGGNGNGNDDGDDADDPSKKKALDPENSTDAGGPLTNQQSNDVQGPNDALNSALLLDIESEII